MIFKHCVTIYSSNSNMQNWLCCKWRKKNANFYRDDLWVIQQNVVCPQNKKKYITKENCIICHTFLHHSNGDFFWKFLRFSDHKVQRHFQCCDSALWKLSFITVEWLPPTELIPITGRLVGPYPSMGIRDKMQKKKT
jgi:hypothetical protein